MSDSTVSENEFGCIPKMLGADLEFANAMVGLPGRDTAVQASQLLLQEISGLPAKNYCASYNIQDWSRKYIENGGSFYIDLFHAEAACPACLDAMDHVAIQHAMLRIAADAQRRVNERLPKEQRLWVSCHNSDGRGQSFGSHTNLLIKRETWNDLFCRRPHYLQFLASFQVAALLVTGQGKVGFENGGEPCVYQIAQRSDFYEQVTTEITTEHRGLVNARNEAECGDREHEFARLHSIYFDFGLCHSTVYLKAGAMQIVCAMLEADYVDTSLLLADPVETVHTWSRDPMLHGVEASLISGEPVTAVALFRRFWEQASTFVRCGGCDGVVSGAEEIIDHWDLVLGRLEARDFQLLSRHLDWVLKMATLQKVIHQRPDLNWASPEIKHLDLEYGSLDGGLYFAHEADGCVERLLSEETTKHFQHNPPERTRAWTRATLLRRVEEEGRVNQLETIDWDAVAFRLRDQGGHVRRVNVSLANPLGHTKSDNAALFEKYTEWEPLLVALGGEEKGPSPLWDGAYGRQRKVFTPQVLRQGANLKATKETTS